VDVISLIKTLNRQERIAFVLTYNFRIIEDIEIQTFLMSDESEIVRETVLRFTDNPKILELALNDPYVTNRMILAQKTKDKEILRKLSKDSSLFVCMTVAENVKIEKDVIRKLLVEETFSSPVNLTRLRLSVLSNPMTPLYQDILIEFIDSCNPSEELISAILNFKFISKELFHSLFMKVRSPWLIKKMITHPDVPNEFFIPYSEFYQKDSIIGDELSNEFEKILLKIISSRND
jgi:hypothetical protein